MVYKVFFIGGFLAIALGCSTPPVSQEIVLAVKTATVEAKDLPCDFSFIGVGESSHIVQLRARVEGYLEAIQYQEGSLVKVGQPMFTLDQRPFVAAVESAKGVLAREEALLWNATQTLKRMEPLYLENAVSQRDLDNAIAEKLSAEANVATAKANLDQAQINLGFTAITSPVEGFSSEAKYREGALISPGEQNLLTTLYVIDPIWVNFNVSERDLLKVRDDVKKGRVVLPAGMSFSIEAVFADGSILPGSGVIDFTNPAIEQTTGTMLMRAVLPNPHRLLYPGQFVRVVLKGALWSKACAVPQSAIIQGSSGSFVYLVREGRAALQPVELGDLYQNLWIINKGLREGDVVIVEGVNRVQNGMVVTR